MFVSNTKGQTGGHHLSPERVHVDIFFLDFVSIPLVVLILGIGSVQFINLSLVEFLWIDAVMLIMGFQTPTLNRFFYFCCVV